ncbi:DUF1800 domain-containing protein [Flavobacterium sp. RSP46]|uniref:DUF1800 domain-containing protein n=1 Tax=unclassified Flavobacterium TaxID=196869 RepID=UPI000F8317B9|nr:MULTISPECIES: DUF1800 family protein [unclassified Flavobacterium]RTY76426.1 DUF1800 domain-containing protein [Flavobacterium sp. LS1R10]RTY92722.1 DUF1800 domain-containing protein [Flavobacterium sp. RSP46]
MSNTINRRNLFNLILNKLKINQDTKDPLFEKYSRKIFTGRRYQSVKSATKSAFTDRVVPVNSGLNPYSGSWGKQEVLHLLKRTGYGFRKADVDVLLALNMTNAVNAVLNISTTAPAPPVNSYNNYSPDESNLPYGADWTNDPLPAGTNTTNSRRIDSLSQWNFGLACNQNLTIKEKMTWFWYHFIPVDFDTVRSTPFSYAGSNSCRILYSYMKMFRDNPLGNYKTLIRKMATQPAMMYYLNNQANTKTSPDENFARELMELFTLGKDPLSQYTEADVLQAAKVLTGWRVVNLNTATPSTNFDTNFHDTSNKQFSSFFNNIVISNAGASELDALIDMIFTKSQVVSEYICRRLYRYFIYYDIDATIESNIIKPLAQTFVANNWEIAPVLNQLFKSQHFYDMANRGVYIKSPFDLVIGSLRTFNLNYTVTDATNFEAQYRVWNYFNNTVLSGLEQTMGKIPNVSGWVAFYQNPSFHEYWINSSTTQKRFDFLNKIFNGYNLTYNLLTTRIEVDIIGFIQQFSPAICANPDLLVAESIQYLLPIDISSTQKEQIKIQSLLSNQTSNDYWTSAWTLYLNDTSNTTNRNIVKSRLKSLLVTLTQLAEYQLM